MPAQPTHTCSSAETAATKPSWWLSSVRCASSSSSICNVYNAFVGLPGCFALQQCRQNYCVRTFSNFRHQPSFRLPPAPPAAAPPPPPSRRPQGHAANAHQHSYNTHTHTHLLFGCCQRLALPPLGRRQVGRRGAKTIREQRAQI